jgi:hypothetical protein
MNERETFTPSNAQLDEAAFAAALEATFGRGGTKGGDDEDEENKQKRQGRPVAATWDDVPVDDLRFLEPTTLDILRSHDVRLVGELVLLRASGDDSPRFLDRRQIADVDDTLIRFKYSRSENDIREIGEALRPRCAAPPRTARGRRAVGA